MDWLPLTLKTVANHRWPLLGTAGVLLVCASFVDIRVVDGKVASALLQAPAFWRFGTGAILLVVSLLVALLGRTVRSWTAADLERGFVYTSGNVTIAVKTGSIQDLVGAGRSTAIVLPANTSFADDCIADAKSALGSFALTHFPDRLEGFRAAIRAGLPDPSGRDPVHGPQWPTGTTILLKEPYGAPARIVLAAVTVRRSDSGIRATPSSIAGCVEEAFRVTRDTKVDHLRMPLIGTGHGGVGLHHALAVCLLAVEHCAQTFHHVRRFEIVLLRSDTGNLIAELKRKPTLVPSAAWRHS